MGNFTGDIQSMKVSDIDLRVRRDSALIIRIDTFQFVKEETTSYVVIEIDTNNGYEYLDEIYVGNEIVDLEDLEAMALNWIFKHVEIVRKQHRRF